MLFLTRILHLPAERRSFRLQTIAPTPAKNVLSEEDKDPVRRLQARDREVRQHEQAHVAALGRYAGAISYTFQVGPDGRSYAICGSTEVLSGSSSSPEATQAKARAIQTAAMSASEPSVADKSAATDAIRIERDAQRRGQKKVDDFYFSDLGRRHMARKML